MSRELKPVDISAVPELVRLAEEVRATKEPRLLRREGEDVAVLIPLPAPSKRRARRTVAKAEDEAFRSAAGAWRGLVDPDALVENIAAARGSDRPPARL
jgi:hypothetical protein